MSEILSVIATAATLLGGFFVWFRKFNNKFSTFMRDWDGEPERPGVPSRPGVLTRLARIEHEVKNNGGGSLKDAVGRVEKTVNSLEKQLTDHIESQTDTTR